MTETGPTTRKKPMKRSDPKAMARFMEELSWLLTSYSDLDFRALGEFGSEVIHSSRSTRNLLSHSDRNPNVRLLVGALPTVLIDEKLFPSNESIADFANATLEMSIPRWAKKSRYELIGHVVCNTDKAPLRKIDSLVSALDRLMESKGAARTLIEKQISAGTSWNEVIQKLISSR